MTAEHVRLDEARDKAVPWKQWGPYLMAGKKAAFSGRVEEPAKA